MKAIFLLVSIMILSMSLPAQSTSAQTNRANFTQFLKVYQLKIAQQYIKEYRGRLLRVTDPGSLILNEKIDFSGKPAPEYFATFSLGTNPYKNSVVVIQYVDNKGKYFYFTYRFDLVFGESSGIVYYKNIAILDEKSLSIGYKCAFEAMVQVRNRYAVIVKQCDNYTGYAAPFNSNSRATSVLFLARGGRGHGPKTSVIVWLRYASRNSVCKIPIGELYFDKEKSVFRFRQYKQRK